MKRIAPVLSLALAALAVTVFAQPAQAATDPYRDHLTVVVRIADLDLNKPEDREVMTQRVERAARQICRAELTRVVRRKCVAETVDYTMGLVSPGIRSAYAAASDRRQSFALAGN